MTERRCAHCDQKKTSWINLKDGRWVCDTCAETIGRDHWVAPTVCSGCNATLEVSTQMDASARKPEPNDISVCWQCGAAYRFSETFDVHRLTLGEETRLDKDTRKQLQRARLFIKDRQMRS